MKTYEFSLRLVVPSEIDFFSEEIQDALFEGGLDDAGFGSTGREVYADFEREGEELAETIRGAVDQIEAAIPGVRVRGISPEELLSASAIAERVGKSREYVRLLANGQRGPGGFPEPVGMIDKQTRVWKWGEVSLWFGLLGPGQQSSTDAQVLAAIDAALTARWHASLIADAAERSHVFDTAMDLLRKT